MMFYAILFLVMGLVAGAVGFFSLSGMSALAGQILFGVFLVIAIILAVVDRRRNMHAAEE